MINFEIPEKINAQLQMVDMVAAQVMRPHSRYYDEHEHELPKEYVTFMWPFTREQNKRDYEKALQQNGTPRSGPTVEATTRRQWTPTISYPLV